MVVRSAHTALHSDPSTLVRSVVGWCRGFNAEVPAIARTSANVVRDAFRETFGTASCKLCARAWQPHRISATRPRLGCGDGRTAAHVLGVVCQSWCTTVLYIKLDSFALSAIRFLLGRCAVPSVFPDPAKCGRRLQCKRYPIFPSITAAASNFDLVHVFRNPGFRRIVRRDPGVGVGRRRRMAALDDACQIFVLAARGQHLRGPRWCFSAGSA